MEDKKTIQYVLTNHKDVELVLMEFSTNRPFFGEFYDIIKKEVYCNYNELHERVLHSGGFQALYTIQRKKQALLYEAEKAAWKDHDYKAYCCNIDKARQCATMQGMLEVINFFLCAIEDKYNGFENGFSIVEREIDEDNEEQ